MSVFPRALPLLLAICVTATTAAAAGPIVEDSERITGDSNTRLADSAAPPETLHVAAGFSVAMFSGGVSALLLADSDRRVRRTAVASISFGSAVVAGAAKEIADAAGFGTPSIRDIFITAAGGAIGTLLVTGAAGLPVDSDSGTAIGSASMATGAVFSIPVQLDLISRILDD